MKPRRVAGARKRRLLTRSWSRARGGLERAIKPVLLAASIAAALMLSPAYAGASERQVSIFEDDAELVYQPAARVAQTLQHLRGLGVDVLRVQVNWRFLAPAPDSHRAPSIRSLQDPATYSAAAWQRYDTLVRLSSRYGLRVYLFLSSPAPDWAGGATETFPTLGPGDPGPRLFGAFVRAVALRYSGRYATPSGPLPRVSFWSIWNEPNQAAFLRPQSSGRPALEASPRVYRGLTRAAFGALRRAGHARDTILFGELAPAASRRPPGPGVNMAPLRFLRALYCVDRRLKPLRGARAARLGCPRRPTSGALRQSDPELFTASGLAVHAYALYRAPEVPAPSADWIGPADLGRVGSTLNRIFSVYGVRRQLPIYVTEFGYKTDPPNPYGVSLSRQAAYMNQAELIGYQDPRVRSWAQFLLRDQPPVPGRQVPDPLRWATFQSGLLFVGGRPKPALAAYRLAFVVRTPARQGVAMAIWGHVRPYRPGRSTTVTVEIAAGRGNRFRALTRVRIRNPRGFLRAQVRAPAGARLRLAWRRPGARVVYSAVVRVQGAI